MGDVAKTIPASGFERVNGNGQTYLFCKYADRDIRVSIAGDEIVMRAGSYQEFPPLRGEDSDIQFYNEDPENPASVIFVTGVGTYDEKLVRGEITVAPGVRKADGRFVDDTRFTISAEVNPVYGYDGEQVAIGDIVQSLPFVGQGNFSALQTKYGEFHWDAGSLIVAVGSIVSDERGLFRINDDLSGWTKITLDGDPFEVQSPPPFTPCPPCDGYYLRRSNASFKQRIYTYDPVQQTNVEVFRAPWDVGAMTYDPVRDEVYVIPAVLAGIKVCRVYRVSGLSGEFLREVDLSHVWQSGVVNSPNYIRFDPEAREFTLGEDKTSGSNVAQLDEDFNLIQVYQLDPLNGNATGGGLELIKRGDFFYGSGEDDGDVLKVAATDSQLTLKGFASSVGCDVSLLDESYDAVRTTAAVTLTSERGRVKVTGQVIKAFLELFYRTKIGTSYLDHVYAATFYSPVSGAVVESVGGQSVTLDRLNVEDDFSIYFPSRVDLVIDSNLPKIGALL